MSYSHKDYKKMKKKELESELELLQEMYDELKIKYDYTVKRHNYADTLLDHVVTHARKAEELSKKLSLELFTVFNNPVPESERVK